MTVDLTLLQAENHVVELISVHRIDLTIEATTRLRFGSVHSLVNFNVVELHRESTRGPGRVITVFLFIFQETFLS